MIFQSNRARTCGRREPSPSAAPRREPMVVLGGVSSFVQTAGDRVFEAPYAPT